MSEHLNYTELADGMYKITPEEGYKIFCTLSRQTVSEAVVTTKQFKYFRAEVR